MLKVYLMLAIAATILKGKCTKLTNNFKLYSRSKMTSYIFLNSNQCLNTNMICNNETIGDGICHDFNNGPFCDYDLGDCCVFPFIDEGCCACQCHEETTAEFWYNAGAWAGR